MLERPPDPPATPPPVNERRRKANERKARYRERQDKGLSIAPAPVKNTIVSPMSLRFSLSSTDNRRRVLALPFQSVYLSGLYTRSTYLVRRFDFLHVRSAFRAKRTCLLVPQMSLMTQSGHGD
jgi:hypothetical protein